MSALAPNAAVSCHNNRSTSRDDLSRILIFHAICTKPVTRASLSRNLNKYNVNVLKSWLNTFFTYKLTILPVHIKRAATIISHCNTRVKGRRRRSVRDV